jgi:hypothetical protein
MRLLILTAVGLACALTGGAHAQGPEPAPPAPDAQAPPAADGALPPAEGEAEAVPAPEGSAQLPPAAEPQTLERALKHFRQGVAFADAGDCSAAIAEFEAAYELVERASALYNIAQCQERLFRYDLAIRDYERYLEKAPADATDRPAVEGALRTLRNLLGIVEVKSNVQAEVWIDDRLAGEAPGEVFAPAGGHTLELRAEGYIPARSEVRVIGQQRVQVELTLVKARTTVHVTETAGLDPIVFWSGVGATVVVAGIGGVFALRVKSLRDDALQLPPVHPDRTERRKEVEDAELLADIFFGSALVLGVGTTVVAFLTDWQQKGSGPKKPAVDIEAALMPGGGALAVGGRF